MPMMESRATVVWQGDLRQGSGKLNVASGAFPEQTVTFGARTEKADGKTNPEELIASAHAVCYSMAFSNTLAQDGSPPERLEVTAVCSLDRIEGGLKITTVDLSVRGVVPNLDAARFEELAKTAEQRCPVSNALRGNVDIRLSAQLAQQAAT
jgi:lipoyl-dependent peroxiredoxin